MFLFYRDNIAPIVRKSLIAAIFLIVLTAPLSCSRMLDFSNDMVFTGDVDISGKVVDMDTELPVSGIEMVLSGYVDSDTDQKHPVFSDTVFTSIGGEYRFLHYATADYVTVSASDPSGRYEPSSVVRIEISLPSEAYDIDTDTYYIRNLHFYLDRKSAFPKENH